MRLAFYRLHPIHGSLVHSVLLGALTLALALAVAGSAAAQQTVGLFQNDPEAYPGYTMYAKGGNTYLIDNAGLLVHTWVKNSNNFHPGFLRADGTLVSYDGTGFQVLDWDSNVLWSFSAAGMHHDLVPLPNGNVLVVLRGSYTNAEAIAAGRDPANLDDTLTPLLIYEVEDPGNIVWVWDSWDHLVQDFDAGENNYGVVEDHPELIDVNYFFDTTANWMHTNAISYNAQLDQIVVSPRRFSELWVIDHSTNTAEAASHSGGNSGMGGDILYRWGNPLTYRAGDASDQQLFGQHNPHWIGFGLPGAGNMLIFNNGSGSYGGPDYSTILEIVPPVSGYNYSHTPGTAYDPTAPVWTYQATPSTDFYSSYISGVQRLPNGNTLIDQGADGTVFEVTTTGQIVWTYINPVTNTGILGFEDAPAPQGPGFANSLFRATRYSLDHPAFAGRDLTPTSAVEIYNSYPDLTLRSTEGGSVTSRGEGTYAYGEGQLVTLVAEPEPGHAFIGWGVIGSAVIADPGAAHTTFVMGASDTTIQANFVDAAYIPTLPQWGAWAMMGLLMATAAITLRSRTATQRGAP